jgi:hypothetical protein
MAESSQQNPKPIPHIADSRKNEAYTIPVVSSVNPKGASRPEYPVDVVWPGNHRRGMLQYAPEWGSRFGGPVLVMDEKVYGASELPKGCKVVVIWREVRTGPVWELIRRAMTIGQFPIGILETDRDEDMYRLMAEITLLRSKLAQKDSQILVLDQRLREAQFLIHKRPWWAFWRRQQPVACR